MEKFPPLPLEVINLNISHPKGSGEAVFAVKDFELAMEPGKIKGLLGPNGAGKTTLLKGITGQISPTSGQIWINGKDISQNSDGVKEQVGAVIDGYCPTQESNSLLEGLKHNIPEKSRGGSVQGQIERLLHELDLWEFRNEPITALSRGMRHKAVLACTFLAEPKILLLDEPTQCLDPQSARFMMTWIKQLAHEKGTAVLIATRQPHIAQALCEQVVVIRRGRVIADQPLAEVCDLINGEFYRIRLKGALDTGRSAWLGGAVVTTDGKDTILNIVMPDQAALYGLLARIRDLAIPLLKVECVEPHLDAVLTYLMHAPLEELKLQRK